MEHAYLSKDHEPMPPEKWETHKDCDLAKREHKWHWEFDIATQGPSIDKGVCVHCGIVKVLTRHLP
jgi:hypothetical protein